MVRNDLIAALRVELNAAADADAAVSMKAYMKSEMPFLGVKKPAQKVLLRSALADHTPMGWDDARDTALALWRDAHAREERYLALALTGLRAHRTHLTTDELPVFDEMIVTGAWWDYVDEIAAHRLGAMLESDAKRLKPIMRRWAVDENVWRRRSAILCQLMRKGDIDLALLRECIEPSLGREEFWLRKAIGWALRSHGRIDGEWVVAFVSEHEKRMSALSKREALKHLGASR